MRALQSDSLTTSIRRGGQAALRQLERMIRRLRLLKCKFDLREKMRSRHASMSFITSVEARNTPKVDRNHNINVQTRSAFFKHLHKQMRLI